MSSTTVITTVFHLLRVKLIAVLLGPSGVAIVAQLNQFILSAANLSSFGSAPGVIRLTAHYSSSKEKNKLQSLIRTTFLGIIVGAGLFVAIGLLFKPFLSQLLLKSGQYQHLIFFAVLAVPATAFFINLRALINGFIEISIYSRLTILTALINLLLIGPFIYFYHLTGIGLYLLSIACISFILAFFEIQKILKKRQIHIWQGKYNRADFIELLKYGGTSLVSILAVDLALMGVRTLIIHKFSENDAGIFQAAFVISAQVITVIISSIGTYAYPRISELKSREEAIRESNNAIRLALFAVTPLVIIVYSLRKELIFLLYSPEFLFAANIIAWQLFGNFIRAVSSSIGVLLLPFRYLKMFWVAEVGQSLVFFFSSFFLLPVFGLKSCTIAYTLAYAFHFIVLFLFLSFKMSFRIESKNIKLLILSTILIIILLFYWDIEFSQSWYWIFIILSLWAAFTIEKREKQSLLSLIKKRWPGN